MYKDINIRKNEISINSRSNRAVTLIALVTTIIVLLILAGISITAIFQNNGVIGSANHGKAMKEFKREEETIMFKVLNAKTKIFSSLSNNRMVDIFNILKEDQEIDLIALKGEEECNTLETSEGVTGFRINLKETKGYIFTLDTNYNISKINDTLPNEFDVDNNLMERHVHDFEIVSTTTATCITNGETTYKCKDEKCGYEYSEVTEEPKGHTLGEPEDIKDPTCTAEGIRRVICSVCNENIDTPIDSLGHTYSETYAYTTEGHYKSCTRCGIMQGEIENHVSNPCSVCGYTGKVKISYDLSKLTSSNTTTEITAGQSYETVITPINSLSYQRPSTVTIRMGGKIITSGYTYNNVDGKITISNISGDVVIIAAADRYYNGNTSFTNADIIEVNREFSANVDQSYRLRIFAFTPTETRNYKFYSTDPNATSNTVDPYAHLFDSSKLDLDGLDNLALQYSKDGNASILANNALISNDDGGAGYNFSMTYNCTAGKTYYLAIRTYTTSKMQNFNNLHIEPV